MWRKIFLTFISVLFSLFLSIWFVLFNLKYFFLQANFYKEILVKAQVYEQITVFLLPSLISDAIDSMDLGESVFPITGEDMREFSKTVLTEDYLRTEIERNIDGFFAFLKGEKASFYFVISLKEPKRKLEESIEEIITNNIDEMPICDSEEVFDEKGNLILDDFSCRPDFISKEVVMEFTSDEDWQSLTNRIPDEFYLFEEEMIENPEFQENLGKIQNIITLLSREFFYLASIITLILGIAIYLIANPKSVKLSWLGVNIFNWSFWPFLVCLFSLWRSSDFISLLSNSYGHSLSQEDLGFISSLVNSILKEFWILFLKELSFFLVISLCLIIGSKILKNKERKEKEKEIIERVKAETNVV